MKSLSEICEDVIEIEDGLMCGTVTFTYDNLMSAMKVGHPMEILDGILARIYFVVEAGQEPLLEDLETTLKDFKSFKKSFNVRELAGPIRDLTEYVKQKKGEV